MPLKNFENIGAVQKYEYYKGVMLSIDALTDTCSVKIDEVTFDEVPIYYHCEPDSVEREDDNGQKTGAIEGAAAGFSVDDEVIVAKQIPGKWNAEDDGEDNKEETCFVIAHYDGIQRCGFNFKIYILSTLSTHNTTRSIRVVQDIADAETGEDFTVIGTGTIDDVGVSHVDVDKGYVRSEPLYLELKDSTADPPYVDEGLFHYFCDHEDGETLPEWVCNDGDETSWTAGADAHDIMAFDHRVDSVVWKRYADDGIGGLGDTTPVDLWDKIKESFENEDAETVNGWVVDFYGIESIKYNESQGYVCIENICADNFNPETDSDDDRQLYISYEPDYYISLHSPCGGSLARGGAGTYCGPTTMKLEPCTAIADGGTIDVEVPCLKHTYWEAVALVSTGTTRFQPFIKSDAHGNNITYPDIQKTTGYNDNIQQQWIIGDVAVDCPECALCTLDTRPENGFAPFYDQTPWDNPISVYNIKTHASEDVEESEI